MSETPAAPGARSLPERAGDTTAENPWPLRLLNSKIEGYVNKMSELWVEGQLVQINRRPGAGVVFMTLRDTDENASISLAISQRDLANVRGELRDGARVVVRAKPTFWRTRGTLQLQASEIRTVGLGGLLAQIEMLKKTLAAEGLFSPERKVPLPFIPQVVGLICGRESKAEHDVVVNAKARWPEVTFEIREVAVQGANAVQEVTAALVELDADPRVDVIVVARGGGSVEDLLPFSNERLVRVAGAVVTPLVSAIGHETDQPLLDLVADYRASTPTDAAKRIVPDVAQERLGLEQARLRAAAAVHNRLTRERASLDALRTRPVLANPSVVIDREVAALGVGVTQLRRGFDSILERAGAEVARLRAQTLALSPAGTLQRGYAVVRDRNRHVVADSSAIAVGEPLEILLAKGRLGASVTATSPETFETSTPEKPAAKSPAVKNAKAKNPATKQPAATNPSVKNPAVKNTAAKNPITSEPAAQKPAANKTSKQKG